MIKGLNQKQIVNESLDADSAFEFEMFEVLSIKKSNFGRFQTGCERSYIFVSSNEITGKNKEKLYI